VKGTGTLPGVDFSEDGCRCNALDLVVVARFPNLVVDPPPTRGLHSPTSQLNVNTFWGIRLVVTAACNKIVGSRLFTNWKQNGSLAKTAEVELRSGRV